MFGCHFDGQPDNGDTHRNSVVLNMRMNGVNGSTTFVEDTGKVVTAYGNAQLSTSVKKYGTASAYFDGAGDYLTLPMRDAFNFGSGDFTIEAWVWVTTVATAYQEIFTINDTSTSTNAGVFCMLAGSELRFNMSLNGTSYVGGVNSSGAGLTANAWHHVAWVRQSGTLFMFANGVKVATVPSTFAGGTITIRLHSC